MSDEPFIFISYDHDDLNRLPALELLVDVLKRQTAFTVFWDKDLRPGQRWDERLAERIQKASAVVVLWTRESRESAFVRDEADTASQQEKLVPVVLEAGVRVPLGHGAIHYVDLSSYRGGTSDQGIRDLIEAIGQKIARGPVEIVEVPDRGPVIVGNWLFPMASLLLLSLLVGGLLRWPQAVLVGLLLLATALIFVFGISEFSREIGSRLRQSMASTGLLKINAVWFLFMAAWYAWAFAHVPRSTLFVPGLEAANVILADTVDLQIYDGACLAEVFPNYAGQVIASGAGGDMDVRGRVWAALRDTIDAADLNDGRDWFDDGIRDFVIARTDLTTVDPVTLRLVDGRGPAAVPSAAGCTPSAATADAAGPGAPPGGREVDDAADVPETGLPDRLEGLPGVGPTPPPEQGAPPSGRLEGLPGVGAAPPTSDAPAGPDRLGGLPGVGNPGPPASGEGDGQERLSGLPGVGQAPVTAESDDSGRLSGLPGVGGGEASGEVPPAEAFRQDVVPRTRCQGFARRSLLQPLHVVCLWSPK